MKRGRDSLLFKFPVPRSLWIGAFLLDLPFEVAHAAIFKSYLQAIAYFLVSTGVVFIFWLSERLVRPPKRR